MSWLMGMMIEEVLGMTIGGQIAWLVWLSVEQLFLATKENEGYLKDNPYQLKKGLLKLIEYLH